jgi:hypothetical protein
MTVGMAGFAVVDSLSHLLPLPLCATATSGSTGPTPPSNVSSSAVDVGGEKGRGSVPWEELEQPPVRLQL